MGQPSVEMTTAEVARQIVQSTRRSTTIVPNVSVHEPEEEDEQQQQQQHKQQSKHNKTTTTTTTLDIDQLVDEEIYIGDTTWSEVCSACWVHSPQEWKSIFGLVIAFFACLYVFGLGLDFLSSGAKVMAGCTAGNLFGSGNVNPVAGVMVGILATVLLQSSSSTTSIVVGLVGADDSLFSVEQGIYMIMGANIGTTVTNTIVALLQFPNPRQLSDAFAGATVHDMFNFLTVLVLLPLEVLTGYLSKLTAALVRGSNTESGDSWEGPVKKIISPLGKKILIANKGVTNAVAGGGNCNDFYPIECDDIENPTYDTCDTGLIGCDKSTGHCPAFFDANAGIVEDQSAGLVVFCMGIFVCFIALVALVQVLTRLLTGVSIRIIHKATTLNGYVLILIGTGLTTMLQSSSTTMSFLTPIAGIGALRLEQMYPLAIGANIGTTITAVLAAMVTDGNAALQVALAHLMFNISGMLIWYPILSLRNIPIMFARRLGQYARVWRLFTLVYLFGVFFALPLIGLGLSALFWEGTTASIAALLTAFLGIVVIVTIRWCYFKGGRAVFYKYLSDKHQRYVTLQTLTTDMERIKRQMDYHCEYAGIAEQVVGAISFNDSRRSNNNENNNNNNSSVGGIGGRTTSTTVDEYAARKAKHEKQVREAMLNVTQDMEYLKAGLTVLNHHTGLWVEDDDDEEEDASTGSSSERDTESPEGPSTSNSNKMSVTQEEKIALAVLWQDIPKVYVFALVAASALMFWGIIALFLHGGKASIGAAYFLLSVFVISVVWGGIVFNPTYVHEYFRNLDRAKRKETIQALPRDMKVLKAQLKRLLQHYKLMQVEDLLLASWNDTNTHTSQSSP